MIKAEVTRTMWLYNRDNLEILKNLDQRTSYGARRQLIYDTLYLCNYGYDKDSFRAKECKDAIEWWRQIEIDVYGSCLDDVKKEKK